MGYYAKWSQAEKDTYMESKKQNNQRKQNKNTEIETKDMVTRREGLGRMSEKSKGNTVDNTVNFTRWQIITRISEVITL